MRMNVSIAQIKIMTLNDGGKVLEATKCNLDLIQNLKEIQQEVNIRQYTDH